MKKTRQKFEEYYYVPGIQASVSNFTGIRVYNSEEFCKVLQMADEINLEVRHTTHVDFAYGELGVWFSILPAHEPSSVKRYQKAIFLFQLCYEF